MFVCGPCYAWARAGQAVHAHIKGAPRTDAGPPLDGDKVAPYAVMIHPLTVK